MLWVSLLLRAFAFHIFVCILSLYHCVDYVYFIVFHSNTRCYIEHNKHTCRSSLADFTLNNKTTQESEKKRKKTTNSLFALVQHNSYREVNKTFPQRIRSSRFAIIIFCPCVTQKFICGASINRKIEQTKRKSRKNLV